MKKLLYRFHNFKYRYKLMILILIADHSDTDRDMLYADGNDEHAQEAGNGKYAGVFKTGSRCNRQSGADL